MSAIQEEQDGVLDIETEKPVPPRRRSRLPAAKRKLERKLQELLNVCFAYLEAEAADSLVMDPHLFDPVLRKEDEAWRRVAKRGTRRDEA